MNTLAWPDRSAAARDRAPRWLSPLLAAGAALLALALVMQVHRAGQTLLALTLLVIAALSIWTYTSARSGAWRYLLPGIGAALVFVVFPLAYTVSLGFTNQSSQNLLSREQTEARLLAEAVWVPGSVRPFELVPAGPGQVRLWLGPAEPPRPSAGASAPQTPPPNAQAAATGGWISAPFAWPPSAGAGEAGTAGPPLALAPAEAAMPADRLPLRDKVAHLAALQALRVAAPEGATWQLSDLRAFAERRPLYEPLEGGALRDRVTGVRYQPDDAAGFYTSAEGDRLSPGYRVGVGLAHYRQLFTEPRFSAPFLGVFAWTVVFSALSVAGAAGLGLLLAVLLNWPALRGRSVYRLVLFLPYAVPGFISILIFKGLFNQNLGEVNLILHGLFGIRPAWFSDPWLARLMLLIVNVWLGFPYMMVLCSGLIQSIPADLYEASAVVGASPWQNFRRITAPLVFRPLLPLLIAAFAFNFNNFVLVSLLTGGRPDQLDTDLPAGTTDLLVTYTWRIAFQDAGQQIGLAAAISTVIFVLVAAITLLQMKLTRLTDDGDRR